MAINIARGKSDRIIEGIVASLNGFEEKHPTARIDVYRQDSVSVRVRVIDPDFAGKTKSQRSQDIWNYLGKLPEELQSDISTILLLTPDEANASFANVEFEDPVPSKL
jgi:stress-induced morphogen